MFTLVEKLYKLALFCWIVTHKTSFPSLNRNSTKAGWFFLATGPSEDDLKIGACSNHFIAAWCLPSVPHTPIWTQICVHIPQHQSCSICLQGGKLEPPTITILPPPSWRTKATPPTSSPQVPSHFPTGTASTSWWWQCRRWDTGTSSASPPPVVGSKFSSSWSAWWVTEETYWREDPFTSKIQHIEFRLWFIMPMDSFWRPNGWK